MRFAVPSPCGMLSEQSKRYRQADRHLVIWPVCAEFHGRGKVSDDDEIYLSSADGINLGAAVHWESFGKGEKTILEEGNNGGTAGLKCQQDSPAEIARCSVCTLCARCKRRRREEPKKKEKKVYVYIYLYIYLFRNDCPRNCGTGPWRTPGEVVVLCAVWGPLRILSQNVSTSHGKRSNGRPRNRFLSFSLFFSS